MYYAYSKRIIRFKVTERLPNEMLALVKKGAPEEVISDTFFIDNEEGIVVAKEKVIYDGTEFGKSIVSDRQW